MFQKTESRLIGSPTLLVHNFVDMGPFLTKRSQMKALGQGFPSVPVLLKTDPYQQSYGPTKLVNQLRWTHVFESLKLRRVLRRVIMIRPEDYVDFTLDGSLGPVLFKKKLRQLPQLGGGGVTEDQDILKR